MKFEGVWRDYQARLLDEMKGHLDDDRLHVVAAPGAGKTVLGLEIVRRLGRPTLIFAPTVAIREQWAQRLTALFLDRPPSSDDISRDLGEPRTITLATYQALGSYSRDESLDLLVDLLNGCGPFTLVLDEAHHLRREWWRCLDRLATALTGVRIVALTATPPYDSSIMEWRRYESLCGPIDLEIGIPELVRNGDLCPHQDHVILSAPTADALALLDRRRGAIADLQQDLWRDDRLLDYLERLPWLVEPKACVEEILEYPEILSAVLILLASAGRDLPKAPMELLGVSPRDLPAPSFFWLERFLDGMLTKLASTCPIGSDWMKPLRDRLHRHGLIEGGRVRLHQTQAVFRLLSSNLAKLDSIEDIARAENEWLGSELRMVILCDHIRPGELPACSTDEFHPAKLGVVPIFEHLRRAGIAADHLGVLTGSLVVVPRSALATIASAAREVGVDPDSITVREVPPCPHHAKLESAEHRNADLVRIVTQLFGHGALRILVGTQSLLGEGWDAPALNSLVLASNTASFMLSNQMRGRAIRTDPANPRKVSNIWHLATIEPEGCGSLTEVTDTADWGYLKDGRSDLSETSLMRRRFRAFEGISNGESTLIESGIGRLGIGASAGDIAEINRRTFGWASDRSAIADRWAESLGKGKPNARVRETAAPSYAPRQLAWHDTLHAIGMSALASGAVAAADSLRHADVSRGLQILAIGAAGAAMLASLPKLVRAALLIWRNGSLEGNLRNVGGTVLEAMHRTGIATGDDLRFAAFDVRSSLDGRKELALTGVSRGTERQVMQAIAELLGPLENPRYLLVRTSWLGWKKRSDYHAVPTLFGANQERAQVFAALFATRIGSSKLVYTRTLAGRRTLLRARAKSLAAGFQRAVDRRSAWL